MAGRGDTSKLGVLLMTYGSPESASDVEEYLLNVRRGKTPGPALVEEFQKRYRVIGGSPLVERTREQAEEVAALLNERGKLGMVARPYIGMRYWQPFIDDAVEQCVSDRIDRVVAIIMSPQYSPLLMEGYLDALEAARVKLGGAPEITVVEHWWQNDLFQQAMAQRIQQALAKLPADRRDSVPLLLTAHSLPRSVYEREPGYVEQLKATAAAVAQRAGRPWHFAYQSAGHTREEWLRPDLTDLFPGFAEEGHSDVVVAPVQFLADHLEVLYDIDVAAQEQAQRVGLTLHRAEAPNTMPTFIKALASIVEQSIEERSGLADQTVVGG